MKHKWITDQNPTDPEGSWPRIVEQKICSVCGCRRWKTVAKNYQIYIYSRSGIVFPVNGGVPDCIDWEVENQKTID